MEKNKVFAFSIIFFLSFASVFYFSNNIDLRSTGQVYVKSSNVKETASQEVTASSIISEDIVAIDTNDNNQLVYQNPDQIFPGPIVGPPPPALTTGETHACFLSTQADTIWCWGGRRIFEKEVLQEVINNVTGEKQLQVFKTSETVTYSTPFIVLNNNVQAFKGAIAISAGRAHTCALKNDGTVWCWAVPFNFENNNLYGQLGDGTNTTSEFPVQVLTSKNPKTPLQGIKAISAGGDHTCALKNDGTVWCWGGNGFGELGDNTKIKSNVAVQVIGNLKFTAVGAGQGHTCAIDENTALWCWGETIQWKLGVGNHLVPHPIVDEKNNQIKGLRTLAHVQTADRFSAFQIKDNSLWGIGIIAPGREVGGPNANIFDPPRQVVDSNNKPIMTIQASTGGGVIGHGCFLNTDLSHTTQCWGSNNYGQLGDGTLINRQFPIFVADPLGGGAFTNLYQIEVGRYFTCAIRLTNQQEVWCWGSNNYGQLGDGTTKDNSLPVRVKLP
ncbi:hypothetical protein HYU23_02495 [Candidatus Woesearchaeota archaeon]|nr:hypothetical protein [Candidatus Woesearchaeota archaeon]